MLGIARLALKGPVIAAGLAAVLLLGSPFPLLAVGLLAAPFSYLMLVSSGAIMTLVMMRLGEQPALKTFLLGAALLLLVALATGAGFTQALLSAGLFWGVAVGAGWVLRQTVRLDLALLLVAAVVAVGLVLVFVFVGDPAEFWRRMLTDVMAKMVEITQSQQGAAGSPLLVGSEEDQAKVVNTMAQMMTGGGASIVFLVASASTLLARSWQARLFNPGGFQPEFHSLRFGRSASIVGVVIIAGAYVTAWPLLIAMAMLVTAIFLFQGLAVAHALVKIHGMSRGWLIGVYILLMQILVLLAALGLLDNWVNMRRQNTSSGN